MSTQSTNTATSTTVARPNSWVPGPKQSGGPDDRCPRTILTVIGARPQFIKAAIISRRLRHEPGIIEQIVHTGQHYDANMSQVFFDELGLAEPDFRLNVRSASHAEQTAQMLVGLEQIMIDHRPDAVLVYGDTNSTLAAALTAAKLAIPLVHVEAGLRSHDRNMPEEINRTITDRLSQLLFCPTRGAVEHLATEGIAQGVHLVGDVMYDAAVHFADQADGAARAIFDRLHLLPKCYVLWTCHRAANVDDPSRLSAILEAANAVAQQMPVVFPVHPRMRKRGQNYYSELSLAVEPARRDHGCLGHSEAVAQISKKPGLRYAHSRAPNSGKNFFPKTIPAPLFIEPVSYLEMLALQRNAAVVVTDSGGMQKEAFILGTPCVTVRENTEWTETIDAGANCLVSADSNQIVAAITCQLTRREPLPDAADYYGGGQAVERIVQLTAQLIKKETPKSLIPNP